VIDVSKTKRRVKDSVLVESSKEPTSKDESCRREKWKKTVDIEVPNEINTERRAR